MPLSDWAAYEERLKSPSRRMPFLKWQYVAYQQFQAQDLSIAIYGAAPQAPTTATTVDASSSGALESLVGASGTHRLVGAEITSTLPSTFIVYDRLSHVTGPNMNTTGEQTTNLPTAALTRYTSGVGVQIGIYVHAGVTSSTATTLTVKYTNQDGTSGRVSPAISFQPNQFRFWMVPFQAGDTGARSVESVTLAATTGNTNALSVVLYKPLAMVCVETSNVRAAPSLLDGLIGGIPEVDPQAYVNLIQLGIPQTSFHYSFGFFRLAQE